MSREKQIEEIAEKMQKCYEKNGLLNFKWFAEALYNAGYRKLPDNVILLDNDCFTVIAVNKSIQEIKNEAVKEFAEWIKDNITDIPFCNQKAYNVFCDMVNEKLKEYEK